MNTPNYASDEFHKTEIIVLHQKADCISGGCITCSKRDDGYCRGGYQDPRIGKIDKEKAERRLAKKKIENSKSKKRVNACRKEKGEKKEESSSKKYAEMDIKEAKKELLGKEITFKKYFFDGVDSYKDAVGKISQVRLYGKEKQPVLAADFPNGDSIQISLKQLDERKASNYEIGFQ